MLIISCSEHFNAAVKRSIPERQFMSVDFQKNAALARRQILERYYDIIAINVPLAEENGIELALDIAENTNAGILIAAPADIYDSVLDYVTDCGVLAISKPATDSLINKAVRFLIAFQNKLHYLEQEIVNAQEKTEELRIVNKAKFLLMEQKHMTEDEAHRLIGKQAMNNGVSRKRTAERIIEEYE